MVNREILYERNLTGSYMKIPVSPNSSFDEKIILKRKIKGALAVERCFVNGHGQYWYNISGRQSLDTYCSVNEIGIEFIERMIISICNEIEILEMNLIDVNCLILDPEMVFVTNQNGELIFTIYPGEHSRLSKDFQQLMEFMLTKIDHKDKEAVEAAYSIYEKTLDDAYNIVDIRNIIVSKKEQIVYEHREENERKYSAMDETIRKETTDRNGAVDMSKNASKHKLLNEDIINNEAKIQAETRSKMKEKIEFSMQDLLSKVKKYVAGFKRRPKPEDIWITAGVEDFGDENFGAAEFDNVKYTDAVGTKYSGSPTVCLRDYKAKPRGILLYSGGEELENIVLEENMTRIGKACNADRLINRDTISSFHAKIEKLDEEFYIEDLNSTNGTQVNGDTLSYKEKRRLEINDEIQFADVRYRFV